MAAATLLHWAWGRTGSGVPAATGPKPERRAPPVFIQDAVTPWQEETMLLSLLRAQSEDSSG